MTKNFVSSLNVALGQAKEKMMIEMLLLTWLVTCSIVSPVLDLPDPKSSKFSILLCFKNPEKEEIKFIKMNEPMNLDFVFS